MAEPGYPAGMVHVLESGDGERLDMGATSVTLKATREHTGGQFFLSEVILAPGGPAPPPHVHDVLHDMFYVLEGTLTLRMGDETRELGAGGFACMAPGTVHTFSNPGDAPVRFLNLNVPGGFEEYMRELGAALAGGTPPTPEEIGRIASRYDVRVV
jgi:quercetin dioxygenase-like cupin family protein